MYGTVRSVEQPTPSLVRVVLGGEGLAEFEPLAETDAYVNVAIPPAAATYDVPFDLAEVRERPPEERPYRRRYTVRGWDADRRRLTLDIVVHVGPEGHSDHGVAGPWAAAAAPGDVLVFNGPAGGYRPDPTADWHLMVGDESALPAIAVSLEAVPAGVPVTVRLVCDGPEHELALDTPGDLDLSWLHRSGGPHDETRLRDAVRTAELPTGRGHAFVHGEAEEIRAVRRHLLADRGLDPADLSCSPYWRRGMTDEEWRRVKKEWVKAMADDVT